MRRTDSLFQLIKALNRADKRNFKLLTQLTSGDKKYLKLFDAIDRQDSYDETRIVRQFREDNLVNQFSVAKNYLYNSILKSLTYFYKGENAELTSLALQVKILIDKNLFPHAQKILRKSKAKARRQENFSELQQLLALERQILVDQQDYKKFGALIEEIQAEELQLLEKIRNFLHYRHLLDEVLKVMTASQSAREKEDESEFERILKDPSLQSPEAATSRRSRILFHTIHRHYWYYVGKIDEVVVSAEKALAIFDESDDLKEAWVHQYIGVLFNCAAALYAIREIQRSKAVQETLYAIKTRSEKANISKFEKYFALSLSHAANAGDVREGKRLLTEFRRQIPKYSGKIRKSSELLLYYYAAILCHVSNNHREALRWINAFLNEPRTEVRTDLQCNARLLNLIIHFELGNFDLVDHSLKSTYRFIVKRDRMYQAERMVLRSVKALAAADSEEGRLQIFKEMDEKIKELKDSRYESVAIQFLLLDSWVSSKLQKTTLEAVRNDVWIKSLPRQIRP